MEKTSKYITSICELQIKLFALSSFNFLISRNRNIKGIYFLDKGRTEINQTKETLFLERFYTSKVNFGQPACIKVSHNISNDEANFMRKFDIRFDAAFQIESIPPMTLYFSSEDNAYGVTMKKWIDGRVFETNLEVGKHKRMDIYPTKYIYYNNMNSECNSEESFYECFGSYLLQKNFTCSNACLTMTLPLKLRNNKTELCKTSEDWHCSKSKSWDYL